MYWGIVWMCVLHSVSARERGCDKWCVRGEGDNVCYLFSSSSSSQAHTARPSISHSDPAPKGVQVPIQWSHLATDPEGQTGQTRPQLHKVRLSVCLP